MLYQKEILDILSENKTNLKVNYHVTKIGLFGSYARNEQNNDSDIDLLIELDSNVTGIFELKKSLREYLTSLFRKPVDIAREKYLKNYAKEEILKDAIYIE